MDGKGLGGVVPPLPTPMTEDRRDVDLDALVDLVEWLLGAGVHGLWVLGTTARFDLLSDEAQRAVAEAVARQVGGRVPLVLNVSDLGTIRTLARGRMFADLPYDYYAVLPPWYQRMTEAEVRDYFVRLGDELPRPLVIYNAPWVCNELSFELLRELGEHPRVVGCKDVTGVMGRGEVWSRAEREVAGFRYLHGSDRIAESAVLGADGFVSALSDVVPELAVAVWEAAVRGDQARAARIQVQYTRLGMGLSFGPMLACLDAVGRHRGLFRSMLPPPLRPLDEGAARRVVDWFEAVGWEPDRPVRPEPSWVRA
ncbi:MAG: dihydrodipicolinate synthase family protein [Isosphaeraceae bacterium]|jgi:4-hydroxy-tetrahydrodipicolinate synthase|nr:MAG: dihydrodipicolinate synthase family protein [Isosphaeraceae bacterium]